MPSRSPGNPAYVSGWFECHCGERSPETDDPIEPFRWLAKHVCGAKR